MSLSSSLSPLNIVSLLIGSGLIVFSINTIYSDVIKRPHFSFIVNQILRNDSVINIEFGLTNNGLSNAHNFTVSIIYKPGLIANSSHLTFYTGEMHTVAVHQENPKKLIIKLRELVAGEVFIINSSLVAPTAYYTPLETSLFSPVINGSRLQLFITSEEGVASYSYYITQSGILTSILDDFTPIISRIFGYSFFLIAPILAVVAFGIPRIERKLREIRLKNQHKKFVSNVLMEIRRIHDSLENDVLRSNIFSPIWYAQRYEKIRNEFFYNYVDYNEINEFYNEVHRRDQDILSNNSLHKDSLKIRNEECLYLANHALINVDWAKYIITKKIKFTKKRIVIVLICGIVAPGIGHMILKHKKRGALVFMCTIGGVIVFTEASYSYIAASFILIFAWLTFLVWQIYDLIHIIRKHQ